MGYKQPLPDNIYHHLYVDGGCVGRNPSPHGGTFAWCVVNRDGKRLRYGSGLILPRDIGMAKVSNNVAELWAAVEGLLAMPSGWAGLLWTDSKVTWWRLTTSIKFNGIPRDLKLRCLRLRTNRAWTPMLLGGHPKISDLEVGYDRRGIPVSRHNCFCDERCRREALRYLRRASAKT